MSAAEPDVPVQPGTVLLLAGPPGAGKTTVAHDLAERWPRPVVWIEGDRFWGFLVRPTTESVRTNFLVLMRSMTAAAAPFARSGHDVILDFSIPPGFVPHARKILRELPLAYAVVLPSEAACAARAGGRAEREGRPPDYEPFRRLYGLFASVSEWPDYERHVIRGDALTSDEVVGLVLDGAAAGRFAIG